MSFKTGTATTYADLLNKLDSYLTSTGHTLEPSFVGTGNGVISGLLGGSASVAEDITITFSSATAFTVTGSITGSIGSGTTGVLFTSTHITFTITVGGTAFVATDAFTVSTTSPWISKRRTAGVEMIWQGPGNGDMDEILIGAKIFSDVGADYYNWRLGGFTAFDSGLPFDQQAGYVGGASQVHSSPALSLWNSSMTYWFVVTGRRVIVIAKVSTVYVVAYLGLLASYASPGSFPLPLVVAGNLAFENGSEPATNSTTWRWSDTGDTNRNFPIPVFANMGSDGRSPLRLRLPSGAWRGFDSSNAELTYGQVWPYAYGFADIRKNLDGSFTLFPIVLYEATPNVFGELDGIQAVTGFQNAAENTVTIGRFAWLVVQNVARTGKTDYFAVKLA